MILSSASIVPRSAFSFALCSLRAARCSGVAVLKPSESLFCWAAVSLRSCTSRLRSLSKARARSTGKVGTLRFAQLAFTASRLSRMKAASSMGTTRLGSRRRQRIILRRAASGSDDARQAGGILQGLAHFQARSFRQECGDGGILRRPDFQEQEPARGQELL